MDFRGVYLRWNWKNRPKAKNYDTLEEYLEARRKHDEGFEAKCREIMNDPEKWVDDNVFEDWTIEGLVQKFIRKEILGE